MVIVPPIRIRLKDKKKAGHILMLFLSSPDNNHESLEGLMFIEVMRLLIDHDNRWAYSHRPHKEWAILNEGEWNLFSHNKQDIAHTILKLQSLFPDCFECFGDDGYNDEPQVGECIRSF
jgi:hypothetical protein